MDFYVYVYYDPRTIPPTPFYVGRGRNSRDKSHLKEAEKHKNVSLDTAKKLRLNLLKIRKINSIMGEGFTPVILKVHDNLSLEESKIKEILLIREFGRLIFGEGTLTNLTSGGEGRVICNAGPFNPFYGKTHSEETKKRLSNVHQGKIISPEQRTKISNSLKGKGKSVTTKELMKTSLRKRYNDNPNQLMFTVLGKSREKHWTLLSPEGTEVQITSLLKWCNEQGFSNKTLLSAFKKNRKVLHGNAKGWQILSCN